MKVQINYGKDGGGVITIERGKPFAVVRKGSHGETFSTRSGVITLADGSEHEAVLEFCDSDSGEHYGTAVWTEKGLVWQEDGIPEALGKTSKEVFPYTYRYHGYISGDHHVNT